MAKRKRVTVTRKQKKKRPSWLWRGIGLVGGGCFLLVICSVIITSVGESLGLIPTRTPRGFEQAALPTDDPIDTATAVPTAVVAQSTDTPTLTLTTTATESATPLPTVDEGDDPPAAVAQAVEPTDTRTALPSATITVTSSLTITNTTRPTNTLAPTNTSQPTDTVVSSPLPPTTTMYISRGPVNVRPCPELSDDDCPRLFTLGVGETFEAYGRVSGDSFEQSTTWWHGTYNGQQIYVHGNFVSSSPPAVNPAPPQNNTNNQQPVVNPPPAQQPSTQWNCNGDVYNCGDFSTCAEVMSYFNTCPGDQSDLDGNENGVPCESLCG